MSVLRNISINEVSLVGKAANKKKFCLYKSADAVASDVCDKDEPQNCAAAEEEIVQKNDPAPQPAPVDLAALAAKIEEQAKKIAEYEAAAKARAEADAKAKADADAAAAKAKAEADAAAKPVSDADADKARASMAAYLKEQQDILDRLNRAADAGKRVMSQRRHESARDYSDRLREEPDPPDDADLPNRVGARAGADSDDDDD
jgi:chemotaxis protein histidine kinase CheA